MVKTLKGKNKEHLLLDSSLKIVTEKESDSVLIIDVKNSDSFTVDIEMEEDSKLVVFYNNASEKLNIKEKADLKENASLKVAYCELESKEVNRTADFNLNGLEASITLITGALCDASKHMEITCNHYAPHTHSEMNTYGLVNKDGEYYVKANGYIQKGAYGSKTHQTSRVLTFAKKQQATILPMLCIDENDVEASHATSIGQLDENQLYYLMSRGLTENDALRLMSLGYLLPLTKVTDDPELQKDLTDLIERKVEEACLI